jgi:hypothetical protein
MLLLPYMGSLFPYHCHIRTLWKNTLVPAYDRNVLPLKYYSSHVWYRCTKKPPLWIFLALGTFHELQPEIDWFNLRLRDLNSYAHVIDIAMWFVNKKIIICTISMLYCIHRLRVLLNKTTTFRKLQSKAKCISTRSANTVALYPHTGHSNREEEPTSET